MSQKLFIIGCCVTFLILSCGLFYLNWVSFKAREDEKQGYVYELEPGFILTLGRTTKCRLNDLSDRISWISVSLKTPSLESFIRASSTEENQELRLRGLAVYSNLTNACQPPVDVSKSKSQVNKIALIAVADPIADGAMCTLHDLALNAQNAGYSVLIYFSDHDDALTSYILPKNDGKTRTDSRVTRDELVIPSLHAEICSNGSVQRLVLAADDSVLLETDRSYVEINFKNYLEGHLLNLYLQTMCLGLPLGPLITLEWFRRKKKLCCLSGGQQVHEERATIEETVGDQTPGVHSDVEQSQVDYNQETQNVDTRGEEHPLITRTTGHTRHIATGRITTLLTVLTKIFDKLAHGCGYVILLVAALPLGISSGGWSFFRFDEDKKIIPTFWDNLFNVDHYDIFKDSLNVFISELIFNKFLPLWWSTFQIFCFFLYSRFACKTTWTVPTNCSKLIRSDWFASNVYLLILGLVVPFCGAETDGSTALLIYCAPYNTVCTICNLLFIIILNKHEFVTRYVFYISVCMICAYAESSIVALYYYAQNSEGSLNHLKLTALRTVALGLTFSLSFSSSMHIIRKLAKPRESLFEALGEK